MASKRKSWSLFTALAFASQAFAACNGNVANAGSEDEAADTADELSATTLENATDYDQASDSIRRPFLAGYLEPGEPRSGEFSSERKFHAYSVHAIEGETLVFRVGPRDNDGTLSAQQHLPGVRLALYRAGRGGLPAGRALAVSEQVGADRSAVLHAFAPATDLEESMLVLVVTRLRNGSSRGSYRVIWEHNAEEACGVDSDCASNEYCKYELTGACGTADESGTCAVRPDVCVPSTVPELASCGCDGRTYFTACEAARAGVSLRYSSACEYQRPLPCDSNEACPNHFICYANECVPTNI